MRISISPGAEDEEGAGVSDAGEAGTDECGIVTGKMVFQASGTCPVVLISDAMQAGKKAASGSRFWAMSANLSAQDPIAASDFLRVASAWHALCLIFKA